MCGFHSRFHTCSICAPPDIRFACACLRKHIRFACPLQLWPERVVACRVSLSSVYSECTKLLLVESGFPYLFFVAISLGYARFFANMLDRLF